jgi:hypothetical protein
MNNKNFNSLYGGNFNNLKDMLVEDVSDTSDYNVSLLNQFQENQTNKTGSGIANLSNLAKFVTKGENLIKQASTVIDTSEKFANQASNIIDKSKTLANRAINNDNKLNNCITIAQSMNANELKEMIEQLQKILVKKLKK